MQRAGHTAYLAGGCVRDQLLGIEAKDCDVATSATAEEVQDLFTGRVTDLVGKSFGVVRVREGEEFFEVAMFRQDGAYMDGRHPVNARRPRRRRTRSGATSPSTACSTIRSRRS